MKSINFIPTILCGGAGSRLWPVSRELHPKPFIQLADGQSLLQKAFLRAAELPDVREILTITNREIFFKIEDEFRSINTEKLPTSYILEPFGRNTAAAIALATLYVMDVYTDDSVLLVLPADHLISESKQFIQAVSRAVDLAHEDQLVSFGIQPTHPITGYGYIEAQESKVVRFVEKPNLVTAQEYVNTGRYLWNSGMFCFKASTLINEFREHCPDILEAVEACMRQSQKATGSGFTQIELHPETFMQVPDQSVDYAVMEKSKNVAVVHCNIGWSDIGSWSAVSNLADSDGSGNSVKGDALLHDTHNCYIQSDERIVGTVGVKDLIIIDTSDAVLVANRHCTEDVKHLYTTLKRRGHDSYKSHRTVHRPWGTYTVLEEGKGFKIKRIEVKPGASLSLQMHHHRSEHWVVVSGRAKVINGDEEFMIQVNESTFIPAKNRHRLANPDETMLVMIEVQTGTYLGEDDIVRFDDVYGRA